MRKIAKLAHPSISGTVLDASKVGIWEEVGNKYNDSGVVECEPKESLCAAL